MSNSHVFYDSCNLTMSTSSTAGDIPMTTPEKAPADTSNEIPVATAETEAVSNTDEEDNTADDTPEQENEACPLMVLTSELLRICSYTESKKQIET